MKKVSLRQVKKPESARTVVVWFLRGVLWWVWILPVLLSYPLAALAEGAQAAVSGRESSASLRLWLQWVEAQLVAALCLSVGLRLSDRPRLWDEVDGGFTLLDAL